MTTTDIAVAQTDAVALALAALGGAATVAALSAEAILPPDVVTRRLATNGPLGAARWVGYFRRRRGQKRVNVAGGSVWELTAAGRKRVAQLNLANAGVGNSVDAGEGGV